MDKVDKFLQHRRQDGLLRELRAIDLRRGAVISLKGKDYIDFSSNDYLGLSGHPKMKQAAQEAMEKFGTSSSASRLLSGTLKLHSELEEKIACFKGKEAGLVFNSGYQANVGIISSLFKKGDVVFADKLSHASIIDGILLSGAKLFRFSHNDSSYLETLLKEQRDKFKNSLIITETIFSMSGDKAPLKEIAALKEKYNSQLMVDEAHATGIFGKTGSGLAEEENVTGKIDLIMGTFSKGLGSFGAYLVASEEVKQYLINTCRSFIYSTSLPASVIAANLASLDLIKEEPFRRKELLENAEYFRNSLKDLGFNVKGDSQIIPLMIGDSQKAVFISEALKKRGHWAQAIRPPTVPQNQARLRFSLTYHHSKETLKKLINDIKEVCIG